MILTLTECSTLENPTYLFRIVNDVDCTVTAFIADDVSLCPERYNQFFIQEADDSEDLLNGIIDINLEGFYSYEVYEQTSTTNLDYTLADNLVECGVMRLVDSLDRFDNTYCEYNPGKDRLIYDPINEVLPEGIGFWIIEDTFIIQ